MLHILVQTTKSLLKNPRPLAIPNWNNWMSVIPDRRKIVSTGRAIFLEVEQAWRGGGIGLEESKRIRGSGGENGSCSTRLNIP